MSTTLSSGDPGSAAFLPFLKYPAQAAFGRPVHKGKLYERGSVSARLKGLFVEQVEQITWQHKLAPETINLAAAPGVPEIQVFAIRLRTPELHRDVLRCIDAAVQYPLIFELTHEGRTQVVAAHRRPSEAEAGRWVFSPYFATPWIPAGTPRAPLPLVLDLGRLYAAVIQTLLPVPARPQEALSAQLARAEQVMAKQRELTQLAARLAKEPQFNRKVALNSQLRQLQADLDTLRR